MAPLTSPTTTIPRWLLATNLHNVQDDDDDDDDPDDDLPQPLTSRLGGPRAAGACDPCKQSKVKCVFPFPGAKCRRCDQGGHDCRVSGRKQKPRPPSHDELLARLREKDEVILHLLMGRTAPSSSSPDSSSPSHAPTPPLPPLPVWDKSTPKDEVQRRVTAWIAEARRRVTAVDDDDRPRHVLHDPPQNPSVDILRDGIVTPHDVDILFRIFFDKINMFFTICDPVLHTPTRVHRSSLFFFTTICAVASRHYAQRPDLYPKLLRAARQAAAAALHGPKAVETCQAYLLLGVYHPPERTFLEDRTFLFLGLAIRMATDLELHLPQTAPPDAPEETQRNALNRARVWLNCFCNDRSISTQLGKPSAIRRGVPYDVTRWWAAGPFSGPHDIHLCAYVSLLQVVSAFHEGVLGLSAERAAAKQHLDLALVQSYADRIDEVSRDWTQRLAENSARRPHPATTWRDNLWPFMVSYAKLVVLSIGLQDGMRQGLRHDNPFGEKCVEVAMGLLTHITETLAHLGYLRYCVEAHFVFMGFAAAFLLKARVPSPPLAINILRPKFAFLMRPGRADAIAARVQRLIDVLGSDATAIDARHTPRLYARFLASVLAQHRPLPSHPPHAPHAPHPPHPPHAPHPPPPEPHGRPGAGDTGGGGMNGEFGGGGGGGGDAFGGGGMSDAFGGGGMGGMGGTAFGAGGPAEVGAGGSTGANGNGANSANGANPNGAHGNGGTGANPNGAGAAAAAAGGWDTAAPLVFPAAGEDMEDMMLHSMAAITDPRFWEHGMVPMPGLGAWPAQPEWAAPPPMVVGGGGGGGGVSGGGGGVGEGPGGMGVGFGGGGGGFGGGFGGAGMGVGGPVGVGMGGVGLGGMGGGGAFDTGVGV